MITLRMLGIAVAILVCIPITFVLADHAIGHVQVPGGEVVNAGLEFAATVTDIALLDAPMNYDRAVIHNAPEQLVEGHTVFVTWDIPLIPNMTNWTFELIGNVECQHYVSGEGQFFQGLPLIPRRINEAHVECQAGETMIVTPDPFYDSDNTYQTEMQPTGNYIPFTAPNGINSFAEELSFMIIEEDWLGERTAHTLYAWRIPTLHPWTHVDGSQKAWYCPIPASRVQEMGVERFTAYYEGDVFPFALEQA